MPSHITSHGFCDHFGAWIYEYLVHTFADLYLLVLIWVRGRVRGNVEKQDEEI